MLHMCGADVVKTLKCGKCSSLMALFRYHFDGFLGPLFAEYSAIAQFH